MAEQINLDGENILDDYEGETLSDDESPSEKTPKEALLPIPEEKGPEFHQTLLKIKEYKRIFPDECQNVCIKNENKLTYEDLLNKIEECKIASSNRKNNSMHKLGFKGVLSAAELYVAPALKMDLRGFTNTAMEDEDLMKTLDEIALMQDWSTKFIPPEQRLLLGLGTLAFRINASNKAAMKQLKPPENEGNYDDL